MSPAKSKSKSPGHEPPTPPLSPRSQGSEKLSALDGKNDTTSVKGDASLDTQPVSTAQVGSSTASDRAGAPDFLASMSLQSLLGKVVDALGEIFEKEALLREAKANAEKIIAMKAELEAREIERERRIDEVKEQLRAQVEKHVQEIMTTQAADLIKGMVSQNLKKRVADELASESQIPETLKARIKETQPTLVNMQVDLYNREAKRYHGTIRSHKDKDPLRPPLRPAKSLSAESPSTSAAAAQKAIPPTPISARTNSGSNQEMEVEPPTPSPLFPSNMRALMRLKLEDARRITAEYNWPVIPEESEGGIGDGGGESREHYINTIMSHSGIPFKLPTSPQRHTRRPTIITCLSPSNTRSPMW
ncbi:hypothetical protein GLOTRDRAFT_126535 [Gloeophyllum trabeum ATCC 11539]|uniref:Uncharacterized protein n=1 Tax=Gloeophyllum trabeum (strain ATCC 11539 / FP-39264 / Madison 617) TaxID=670483 RepID=S7QE21_GLOTA|nr:uncharacterized protein GLOTRDRAFT_126535 [Gloeophyllum trabeum ATCC 11539]EPQ58046.1 hypothetical protein GLOTRDRAFT_126535 [Gloeophyllum trabeum ATCC 11539]